jgi:hypothetical protein
MDTLASTNLADELIATLGTRYGNEAFHLIERNPDLILDYLRETGRLTPTMFEFVPGRRGYAYSRLSSERDDVPSSTKRANDDTPDDMRLWRLT